MKFLMKCVFLLFLVVMIKTQDFDLSDALDPPPTPAKPKVNVDEGFDLSDAFGPDPVPDNKPKKPAGGGSMDDILDGLDFGPTKTPARPKDPQKPAGGGGGTFNDEDLFNVGKGDNYKPDAGKGRMQDPSSQDGAGDQPKEAGPGQIAGIASAIGVALLGAASSYFAYQKKKLCFKIQGGADPESGKGQSGNQSDPQSFSNLLRIS